MTYSQETEKRPYLVGICAYNEGDKIRRTLEKFNDYNQYDVLLIDDGSTDGSLEGLSNTDHFFVIRNQTPQGAGFGTRQIAVFARDHGYETMIFVSGNDKDDAHDACVLIGAIERGADFVQGSRYLPGGGFGNMPLYRRVSTQYIHPWLFSLISGRRITDSTNGFRAVKVAMFFDERMDIHQTWLDQYELEPYIFYYAIKLGYQVAEVPVRKIYPPHSEGYTKMKPFSGWWSILRPLLFLGLGIKR